MNSTDNHGSHALSPLWAALRDEVRARRDARATRRTLESELAHVTTQADIAEMNEVLSRYDEAEAEPIRQLVAVLRAA